VVRSPASWLLCLMTFGWPSILSITAAGAGSVVGTAPASCGPQFMLYMTLPLWSGGHSSLPLYGLRMGQFRKRPTTTQLVAVAPVQRELIDLQMVPHSDVRIEFGRRLIWDIPRGSFGPQSSAATLAIGVPIRSTGPSDPLNQQPRQPWDPVSFGMNALPGDPMRPRQADRERVGMLQVVISSPWVATDWRATHIQLRPVISLVNTQQTEAALLQRGAASR
jgi:hypothetical protein